MYRDNAVNCHPLRRPAPCYSRAVFWLAVLLFTIPFSAAQETSSRKGATQGKAMLSGKTLFMEHCASCHGDDAKGAGPAALALKSSLK